jgi:hypothetical protein
MNKLFSKPPPCLSVKKKVTRLAPFFSLGFHFHLVSPRPGRLKAGALALAAVWPVGDPRLE